MLLSPEEIGYLKDSQLILDAIDKIKTFVLEPDNVTEVRPGNSFFDDGKITLNTIFRRW